MKISDLIAAPYNPRTITDESMSGLKTSIRELGDVSGIVWNKASGHLICGHQRVKALKSEFGDDLVIEDNSDEIGGSTHIRTPSGEIFAIRIVEWGEQKERLANVMANNPHVMGDFTKDAIGLVNDLNVDFPDLTDGLMLAELLEELELEFPEKKKGDKDPDAIPDPPAKPITQHGDVWVLGKHRLLCGDAIKQADVDKVIGGGPPPSLMVTDPPYGVEYDPAWRAKAGVNKNKKKMGKVENDDQADWSGAWKLFPGDVAYVYHAGARAAVVQASLAICEFEIRAQIIWAKDRMALSRGDYHWQHEPCWYAVRAGKQGQRTDDRSQTTLWTIPAREDKGHGHGTQKPVECMSRPIRNHNCEVVYDPFMGSGTTLIAAEQTGRHCYGIEIDPVYVDVAVKRWAEFAGQDPIRESDGAKWSELLAAQEAEESSEVVQGAER